MSNVECGTKNAYDKKHVQASLIFCLSLCLRVRAVPWRQSDNKCVKRWNAAARLLYSVAMGQTPRCTAGISS